PCVKVGVPQPRIYCRLLQALAHVNTNAVEAAYRRTDLFERRRALMEEWAGFLAGPAVSPSCHVPECRSRALGLW
ncbi:MAG: hypothetical protein OYL41_03525, partial [Acidobacteriota bacterium]|nr:hypothetical protein [Acidobacteriota bacterium]